MANLEEVILVPGLRDIYASREGEIYSKRSGELVKLKKSISPDGFYERVSIYCDIKKRGIRHFVHSLILNTFTCRPSCFHIADHKNRNGLDNRIENLRWATRGQNAINQKTMKNNKSNLKGAAICAGRYFRCTIASGVFRNNWSFKTAEECHIMWCLCALYYWGEFANPGY